MTGMLVLLLEAVFDAHEVYNPLALRLIALERAFATCSGLLKGLFFISTVKLPISSPEALEISTYSVLARGSAWKDTVPR